MADNVTIPASGTGTATPNIATDDVGGVQHQRVKVEWGADGVATDTSAANPLPVVQTGTPSLPTGAATEATLAALNVLEGAVNETAPASDTANSGLNGRLQRVAQRLTSLIAQIPATLGQKTSANSLAVVVASDQSAVPVSGTVTANIGTAGTLALDATLTGGTQKTKLVDTGGTNVGSISAAGALKVDGSAVTQPVSGTVTTTPPSNASTNVAQINGVTPLMGTGNTGTGSPRVTLATDQVNLTTPLNVGPVAVTAGGLLISRTLSAASTNATSVKGSAGQVYTIYAVNLNAAVRYLKLYNKASAPTVGTDTPVMTLPIPASTTGAGFVLDTGGIGVTFATGIALALTTGIADADTGAVAANEIIVHVLYK